jgi:hypothetical protein
MIIDVHAHYVPASLLDVLCAERRMFPSIEILGERNAVRMAFCGQLTLQNGEMNAVFFDRTR